MCVSCIIIIKLTRVTRIMSSGDTTSILSDEQDFSEWSEIDQEIPHMERKTLVVEIDEQGIREEEVQVDEVSSLRYIDYICGHVKMKPVIQAVEKILGIPIEMIPAPGDTSGPR